MMSIISLNYFHDIEIKSYTSTVDLIGNCKSAEAILLSEFQKKDPYQWYRATEFLDSTHYQFIPWGIWQVGLIKSKRRNELISDQFLFGSKWSNNHQAILLKNGISGLSISGKTNIIGDALVPGGRVKPAFIEGQSFNGNRLVKGSVHETPGDFPTLSQLTKDQLMAFYTADSEEDSLINYVDAADNIKQPFSKKRTVLYSRDSISVLQKQIEGHVIIKSEKAIYLSPFSKLTHVICIAPRIHIGEEFKGSIQCLATQQIHLSENTRLSYPSSTILLTEPEKSGEILIDNSAVLEGVAILLKAPSDRTVKHIQLNAGAIVRGQIISEAACEIKGQVYGQVITNEFTLRTPSASYKNHLLNAEINVKELPSWFCGAMLKNHLPLATKMNDL